MNPSSDPSLLQDLSHLIEQGKRQVAVQVNQAMTLVFWQVGRRINQDVLQHQRATYGAEIIENLAVSLVGRFGRSFTARNLRRMMQFAEVFPDREIVTTLSAQLRERSERRIKILQ